VELVVVVVHHFKVEKVVGTVNKLVNILVLVEMVFEAL
jgi:hypothetical protein